MKKTGISLEYLLSILLAVFVVALYVTAWIIQGHAFAFVIALFSSLLGAFLIPFGFWGADFAFDAVRRGDEHVYVPFLARTAGRGAESKSHDRGRDYSPLEWWNLNWLVITIGVAFLLLGLFVIGYTLGKGFV